MPDLDLHIVADLAEAQVRPRPEATDVDLVHAIPEVMDVIAPAALLEHERVMPPTANQAIVALAAGEDVVTLAAVQGVVAAIAGQPVVAIVPLQDVRKAVAGTGGV